MPYSTRFYIGLVTSTDTVIYTVPSGFIAIVRDIEIVNAGGTTDFVSFYIAAADSGPAATLWKQPGVVTSVWDQWHGRVVMNAGDALHGFSGSVDFQAIVSGYLLTSP